MKIKTTLFAFILALFSVNAQSQSFTKSQVYDSLKITGQNNQVTLFDYDEDGDDDVFCYGATNDSRVLVFNNNNGSFDSSFVFYSAISTSRISDITILDYDNDSDLDLIAFRANSGDILKFENNNNGNFTLTTQTNILPGAFEYLDNADMDNDGLPDLVYMIFMPRQVRWVKNLGAGIFSSTIDTVAVFPDRMRSFELADLDNDGDMDVITQYQATTGTASAMSINDGTGNFATTLNFPIPYSSNNYSYTLGDFNNDSLVDVAYVTAANSSTQQLIVLWNDSSNTFNTNSVLAISSNPIRLKTVEKFDFDGDNDLDLLVGQNYGLTSKADGIVLNNQGNKNFVSHSKKISSAIWGVAYNGNSYRGIEMFFSDFDSDGNMDILSNSYADQDLMVHFQQNDSSFLNPTYLNHSFTSIESFQILDYNNDGNMDLATVNENNHGKLEMAYGDGANGFDSSEVIADNRTAWGAVGTQLAFWNNNTDYDLILSSTNQVFVHLDYNTPNDSIILLFTSNPSSTIGNIGYPNNTNKIFTVADVDNDGDNDLIIPQQGNTNPYYWVENTGAYTTTARTISSVNYNRYLLTDVDGDADLDFVGQRFNTTTSLTEYVFFKMNPVTKTFTNYLTLSTPNMGTYQFAAGDIDGDNDEDIVISGLMWMENDSAGNFSAPATLASGYTSLSSIVIDDINNDGLVDIITNVTRQTPTRQLIVPLFNQDSNIFVPLAQELEVAVTNQHAIALGDFNGNGFKSIVVGDFGFTQWSPVIFDFCINSEDTIDLDVCSGSSYTYADGTVSNNITANESYVSTLSGQAANGCDSIVTENLNVLSIPMGVDIRTECNSYTWIDGNTYTASNNSATFTIVGGAANGCDSVVTLDLTIVNPTSGTDTKTECNAYTWIDGNTYTASNNSATFTIVGGAANGCDSLVTLDLTIVNATSGTDTKTECNAYTWIDGNTYTANNNTATFTIVGGAANGCDSLVTLDLTIVNATSGTDTRTECNAYTWIDGNTYTASNNSATFTIVGGAANGCDSLVTLDLTIVNSTSGTDTRTECSSYTWIDGNTYTASNNSATFTIVGGAANGCDSLVTLDLTINNVSDLTTSISGAIITANNSGANYQWLDCDNSNATIPGETAQSYTALSNGNYAVELTENGCVDTSACVNIITTAILENNFGSEFSIYPNPTKGKFSVDLDKTYNSVLITITDLTGRLIESKEYNGTKLLNLKMNEPAGMYLMSIESGDQKAVIRLVKE